MSDELISPLGGATTALERRFQCEDQTRLEIPQNRYDGKLDGVYIERTCTRDLPTPQEAVGLGWDPQPQLAFHYRQTAVTTRGGREKTEVSTSYSFYWQGPVKIRGIWVWATATDGDLDGLLRTPRQPRGVRYDEIELENPVNPDPYEWSKAGVEYAALV